jgi:hypothetical protein
MIGFLTRQSSFFRRPARITTLINLGGGMARLVDEDLSDGYTTNDDHAAAECSECECGWYEPATGACLCGHSIAQHGEPEPESDL